MQACEPKRFQNIWGYSDNQRCLGPALRSRGPLGSFGPCGARSEPPRRPRSGPERTRGATMLVPGDAGFRDMWDISHQRRGSKRGARIGPRHTPCSPLSALHRKPPSDPKTDGESSIRGPLATTQHIEKLFFRNPCLNGIFSPGNPSVKVEGYAAHLTSWVYRRDDAMWTPKIRF